MLIREAARAAAAKAMLAAGEAESAARARAAEREWKAALAKEAENREPEVEPPQKRRRLWFKSPPCPTTA